MATSNNNNEKSQSLSDDASDTADAANTGISNPHNTNANTNENSKKPPTSSSSSKHSENSIEDEFPVLPIEELPKKYQEMFQEFTNYLNQKQPQEARLALRPLIAYYIEQKREIPLSVEVGYGKLLVLEELNKLGKL